MDNAFGSSAPVLKSFPNHSLREQNHSLLVQGAFSVWYGFRGKINAFSHVWSGTQGFTRWTRFSPGIICLPRVGLESPATLTTFSLLAAKPTPAPGPLHYFSPSVWISFSRDSQSPPSLPYSHLYRLQGHHNPEAFSGDLYKIAPILPPDTIYPVLCSIFPETSHMWHGRVTISSLHLNQNISSRQTSPWSCRLPYPQSLKQYWLTKDVDTFFFSKWAQKKNEVTLSAYYSSYRWECLAPASLRKQWSLSRLAEKKP